MMVPVSAEVRGELLGVQALASSIATTAEAAAAALLPASALRWQWL